MQRTLAVITSFTLGFAVAPVLAASQSGTGLTASVSTASHLTTTYVWSLAKSADPTTQMVAVGSSANVHWTISATRSASGMLGGYVDGQVCVSNTGPVPTQGLAIGVAISAPPSSSILASVSVDVSAKPVLAAGASECYAYQAMLAATALVPGASYKATAHVSVTNHSGSLGTPSGPPPSATSLLPTTAVPIDSTISVSDSNGKTFTFASGGSQSYDQSIACASADGPHTITQNNTVTLQSASQSAQASASATVHCGAPTTLTTGLSAGAIRVGGSVSDQATILNTQAGAAGTISYRVYSNSMCSGTPVIDATPTSNAVSSGSAPASQAITFNAAGTYYWQAVYSGDAEHNTLGSLSDCASEKLVVTSCTTTGTMGCPWQDGDLTTYNQTEWGGDSTSTAAALLLATDFKTVYASAFGELTVGGGFTMSFGGASAIEAYLPQTALAGSLDASLSDPTTSASGKFGGDVVALELNTDFSDMGLLDASSRLKFGDLTICNSGASALDGTTIRDFLTAANTLLGGGASSFGTIVTVQPIAAQLNNAFLDGTPSAWAQQHLENGPCGWHDGDLTTYAQADWGAGGAALEGGAALLVKHYGDVYAVTVGGFQIGSTSGFTILWTNVADLSSYLPASGAAAALNGNLTDPASTVAGIFGGDVAALKLNVDFADAGFLTGASDLKFGDLTVCGLSIATDLNGLTVRQVLAIANTSLGAGITSDSLSTLDGVASDLDASFDGGSPSTFASQHLARSSACQPVSWQNGDLVTYQQTEWSAANSSILINHYGSVYAATAGGFEIGGFGGFTALWTNVSDLSSYLPASGTAAALTANVTNPASTSSGIFGGDVAAIKLNIDYADAGVLPSSSGLKFGDLTICGLTSDTDLNGNNVRNVLSMMNTALGGGSTMDGIADLEAIATNLNASFAGGTPSTFAQDHLVAGSCP